MCIAIYQPRDRKISEDRLIKAYKANPDGCGFIWVNKYGLQCWRCFSLNKFLRTYQILMEYQKYNLIIHLRTASSSQIGVQYCHPFYVNENLAFVHNGNFYEFSQYFGNGQYNQLSDTQAFNEFVLKKLPNGFLQSLEIKQALENYCRESMSKIIFLESSDQIHIINEQAGYWENDIWYSNGGIENYIGYGYSGAYYYNSGDVRHKGGLITTQIFSEANRKKWQRCEMCKGYYLKEKIVDDFCGGCWTLKKLLKYCDGVKYEIYNINKR